MIRRIAAGLLALAAFSGIALAEIPDYKNIKVEEVLARGMRDIAGEDVELRRVATDDMKMFADRHIALLGVDGEAHRALVLLGDGIAELYWLGKPTSRMRAERLMDDIVKEVGKIAVSPDAVKAGAAQKLLARYVSGLLRNPENSSAKKEIGDIRAILARTNFSDEIAPAVEVATFLDTKAPAGDAAPSPVPEPAKAPAPVEKEPAPPPVAKEPAEPPPAPVVAPAPPVVAPPAPKQETVTVTAPPSLQPKSEEQATPAKAPEPAPTPAAPPRVVSSGDWKYSDPALKVTTVVAPKAAEEPAPAPKAEPPKEAFNDGTSILNILIAQLKSEDERRLESGLKLTSKTADAVLSNLKHGSDPRSVEIMRLSRERLDHKNIAVRKAAMKACAALQDKAAAPKLIDMLVSGDENLSAPAYTALKELSGLDLGPTRDAWDKWAATKP